MIGHNEPMTRRCTDVPARLGRWCVVASTLISVGLTACSGDDDTAASTSVGADTAATSPATEPASTSALTTASSMPATTASTATTTSTGPSTTASPPTVVATTPAPASTVLMSEEAVAEAARRQHATWTDCLSKLPTCDAVETSTAWATGELSDVIYVQASGLNDDGRRTDQLETRTITIESVELDPAAGTATVVACENDGSRLLGSDGTVLNDAYVSRRLTYTFLSNGERWLGSTRVEQQRADGVGNGLCAAG